jgi:hypothetical protein
MSEDTYYGHSEWWNVGESFNTLFPMVHTTALDKRNKTMKNLNTAIIQIGYVFEVSDITY